MINRTIKYVSIFFCNKLDTDLLQYFNRYNTRHLLAESLLSGDCTCKITFEQCKVLTFESDMYRRKIKESLFIQQFDDGSLINDKMASVPLFLFNLPTHQDQLKGKIFPSYR